LAKRTLAKRKGKERGALQIYFKTINFSISVEGEWEKREKTLPPAFFHKF
jgi:hypothetical protein